MIWVAVETVIAEQTVRELFPRLLESGARSTSWNIR